MFILVFSSLNRIPTLAKLELPIVNQVGMGLKWVSCQSASTSRVRSAKWWDQRRRSLFLSFLLFSILFYFKLSSNSPHNKNSLGFLIILTCIGTQNFENLCLRALRIKIIIIILKAWWPMPFVILEAGTDGSLGLQGQPGWFGEDQASQGYMEKPCLKTRTTTTKVKTKHPPPHAQWRE